MTAPALRLLRGGKTRAQDVARRVLAREIDHWRTRYEQSAGLVGQAEILGHIRRANRAMQALTAGCGLAIDDGRLTLFDPLTGLPLLDVPQYSVPEDLWP